MLSMLTSWQGAIEINGTKCDSINEFKQELDTIHIKLYPKNNKINQQEEIQAKVQEPDKNLEIEAPAKFKIKVKQYMTKKATPEFDFMQKWNNNNPMPLRIMVGEKVKETRGMVYMKLHGDILAEQTCVCMKCGRTITNPVSKYFGMGPECGGHNYVHPFDTMEELKDAVSSYKKELQEIKWEGWIIKSAIEEEVRL